MKTMNALLVAISTFTYASIYWLGNTHVLEGIMSTKPFVYRQLVPILARLISGMGIRIDYAIIFVVVCAGVGFYLALRELFFTYYPHSEASDFLVTLSVLGGLFMFEKCSTYYDLMTAFLFTLALLFIAQGKLSSYLLLFPLICLNRETAFLLTIFLLIYNKNIVAFVYQVLAWMGIRVILSAVFAQRSGAAAWVEPIENLQKFIENYPTTILHLFIISVLLFFVLKDWDTKPLTTAFVVFAPLLVVMYIVLGQAFEVRVFWEIYPIIVVMSIPTVLEMLLFRNSKTFPNRKVDGFFDI